MESTYFDKMPIIQLIIDGLSNSAVLGTFQTNSDMTKTVCHEKIWFLFTSELAIERQNILHYKIYYKSRAVCVPNIFQDQCAWAIGNLAGGSKECRDILRVQGALTPLINLLQVLFATEIRLGDKWVKLLNPSKVLKNDNGVDTFQ